MDILPQLLINGLISGSTIALIAVGLSLIFGVLKFMNFAHGEIAMLGAYFYYYFFITLGWPVLPSMAITVALCAFVGFLFNRFIFWPLRKESQWTLLIVSVGVGMLIKNSVQLVASGSTRTYSQANEPSVVHHFFGDALIITSNQILIIVSAFVLMLGLFFFLKYSKLGKSIRALSDNMSLAGVVGIDIRRSVDWIFVLSSAIAGFAGILIAYEESLTPNMGQHLSILAFVAVILGGLGSIPGALVGGLLIGLLQDVGTGLTIGGYSIPSSYKSLIAFSVLILFLLFRPRGLFGISLEEDKSQKE